MSAKQMEARVGDGMGRAVAHHRKEDCQEAVCGHLVQVGGNEGKSRAIVVGVERRVD